METVSVIIATLNESADLEKCLESIRQQNYDQKKIEIIVADGGSIDNTPIIIKKYRGKLIPEKTNSPEMAKAIALQHAIGELILMVDSDNILPHKNWLIKMVEILEKEPEVTACYPWQYAYKKSDNLLNRYFALLGINDPIPWFLGKADKQSYFSDQWILSGKAANKGSYFLVEFNEKNTPTLGANGFLIRKSVLQKARINPSHFFHIDVNVDLISQGLNKYAVIKDTVIHTGGDSLFTYLRKKKRYMDSLYLRQNKNRRYFIYRNSFKDFLRLSLFSLYALTLIGPLIHSVQGYVKLPDRAWFLHPVMCFLMFWLYAASVSQYFLTSTIPHLLEKENYTRDT